MPAAAESPDEVLARIRARSSTLPPAEAKVAEAIAQDPFRVANSTVMELRGELGVSEATIVRAARNLGFSGYPQLRLALAGVAGRQMSEHAPALTQDISVDDSLADVVAKLSAAEQQAIRETAAQLDAEVLAAAADAIAGAGRTVVFGVGASGLVAQDLQQKLIRAGLISLSPPDAELALTGAALLAPDDVAVLISQRGRNAQTAAVLEVAAATGATTVAVTGSVGSPIATRAQHVLLASTHDLDLRPAALASRMSQLLVIDCLFVAVIQRTWAVSEPALAATRAAIESRS